MSNDDRFNESVLLLLHLMVEEIYLSLPTAILLLQNLDNCILCCYGELYRDVNGKHRKRGPIRILDGSGSGASGMACISCIRRLGIENPVELHALDYSGKASA